VFIRGVLKAVERRQTPPSSFTSGEQPLGKLHLEHVRFDNLPFIEAGAVVENKRLGHALKVAQLIQAQRDDRRCGSMPSRTNSGAKPRLPRAEIGKKRPSKFTLDDMNAAVRKKAA